MSNTEVAPARAAIKQFLSTPGIASLEQRAAQLGFTAEQAPTALDAIANSRTPPTPWSLLLAAESESPALPSRWILNATALRSLDRIPGLPVVAEVRDLILRTFRMMAEHKRPDLFVPEGATFRELAQVALLKRFIAGQLHWNISGIPRSWPLRMSRKDATRTLLAVARMGGWAPCFEAHLPTRGAAFLIEAEYKRCYVRMAQSMELQPGVRAVIGASWLHAEETMRISPHLEWINRLFLDNGGLLVHMGLASSDSGFLLGSRERRELYDSGAYRPRNALFIWPRKALLEWARRQ